MRNIQLTVVVIIIRVKDKFIVILLLISGGTVSSVLIREINLK